MTEKQKRFIEEYLIDLNATQAAIRSGYSPDTAQEQGSRLLSNVMVKKEIDKAMAERSRRTGVNADRIVLELARIAFANSKDVIDYNTATVKADASRNDTAAVQSVKVKTFGKNGMEREVKMADKLKALELLGRHQGMFRDKLVLSGMEAEKSKLDDLIQQLRSGDE